MIERGLAHELEGSTHLEYRADGVVCTIKIPAPQVLMDKVLSGRHILVVEDEMMNLMMIEDMLADLAGASVSAAATVDQALVLIKRQSFGAAMLDLNLNGMKSYAGASGFMGSS